MIDFAFLAPPPEATMRTPLSATFTAKQLEAALIEAKDAHAAFEKELGYNDVDWPRWYANRMVERHHSEPIDFTGPMIATMILLGIAAVVGILMFW